MLISKSEYLRSPCQVSSIPYWKTKKISIPDNMRIVHDSNFNEMEYQNYIDEPYFRLMHNLQDLCIETLPYGYSLCEATLKDFANHINSCYDRIYVTERELQSYTTRSVYSADLWIAIKYDKTNEVVATGIAELDKEIGEGCLEWIEVSERHRSRGIGKYIVSALLQRMKVNAKFATVSGQCNNDTHPEILYRKCGFIGADVWHILKKI